MNAETYYQILGVKEDASIADIKSAYRRLALEYHPDSAGGSEEKFQKLAEAYEILVDDKQRQIYDLRLGLGGSVRSKIDLYAKAERQRQQKTSGAAADEEAQGSVDDMASPNTSRFSGRASQIFKIPKGKNGPAFGERLKNSYKVLFGNAETELKASATAQSRFDELRGERFFNFTIDALESIHGTSREVAIEGADGPRMIRIKVPAGVEDGATLRIETPRTENDLGEFVKIHVNIRPHELLERDGLDIVINMPITIREALNGGQLNIPTLDGNTKVKLPPQSVNGKRLRLKGRGVTDPNGKRTGDLYVKPFIVLPKNVNETVKHAAEAIDAAYSSDIRAKFPRTFKKS